MLNSDEAMQRKAVYLSILKILAVRRVVPTILFAPQAVDRIGQRGPEALHADGQDGNK